MKNITKPLICSMSMFIACSANADTINDNNNSNEYISYSQSFPSKTTNKISYGNIIINHSEGPSLPSGNNQNTIIGKGNTITGSHNTALGSSLTVIHDSIAIGNNSHAENNSASFGSSATSKHDGIAIGTRAYANNGIAIGHRASAVTQSIAIGDDSKATKKGTVSFGGVYYKSQNIDGKLTTKIEHITRRLINVSSGENATDAVNVSQLTKTKDTLAGEIVTNRTHINNNNKSIIDNKNNINKNAKEITTNGKGIDNNNKSIIDNKNNINNNTKEMTSNRTNITNNKADVNINTNDIKQFRNQSIQYADNNGKQTLKDANNYTDDKIKQVSDEFDSKLHQLRKEENAGIASAMAMSVITVKQNHKYNIGIGLGYYADQEAIAIGSKINTTKDSILSLDTAYNSNHNFGVAAGMTFGFN